MMIPLGCCSVIMVIVIIERAWILRSSNFFPFQEIENLRRQAEASKDLHSLEPALNHAMGRILSYGLHVLPASSERFKEAIQDQARRELHYAERGLVMLEIIVGVAPLLGLLGTALGMISVFANIAIEAPGRAEALSQGIAEALITTVLGLAIGIPALVAYTLFSRRVESLGLRIEQEMLFFYHKLYPHE